MSHVKVYDTNTLERVIDRCVSSTDHISVKTLLIKDSAQVKSLTLTGTDIDIISRPIQLPLRGVMLYSNDDIANVLATYVPPTLAEIFNNWTRIGNDNGYYPKGTTPTGEAASWSWNGSSAVCTANTLRVTAFISPDEFEEYDSHTTFAGAHINNDDDCLVFVMAYKRDGNVNKLLSVVIDRQPPPYEAGCYITYGTISVVSPKAQPPNTVPYGTGKDIAKHHVVMSTGAWGINTNKVRVRVIRKGTIFTIYVSPITTGTPVLDPTPIVVDASSYSDLDWVEGPLPYGYGCQSQEGTFTDISLESASNDLYTIYNIDTGQIWRWSGTGWEKDNSSLAWDTLGYPRIATSKDNIKYQILDGKIIKL